MKWIANSIRFTRINKYAVFLLFMCSFLYTGVLRGSHIVGGEVTYKFIQRENKKITYRFLMKIYKDKYLSNQNSDFDNPARIAIYLLTNNGNKLFGSDANGKVITVPIKSRSDVDSRSSNPCLTAPSNIGVEEAIYEWDAVLYDTSFSYVVTYQRCCRNNNVINIYNSGTTGATYSAEITPESQHLNNSSPTFKTFPPIFICSGEPLKYDHGATDDEGDQLVYKFCSPLTGGTSNNPSPNPPASPPYVNVSFKQPTYTPDKPMGGTPPVVIDASTGIITGNPSTISQYVMSVCVEEYRNGKLLGKIYRDFQFYVANCQRNISAEITSDSSKNVNSKKNYFLHGCENVTVTLSNQSYNRNEINNFYWEFDNKGVKERYTDWNPTITFRDTGTYLGKLVLNPDLPCGDSAFINVFVGGNIKTAFEIKYDTCVAGAVNFKGVTNSSFPLKEIVWDFGDTKRDSNKLVTSHEYSAPGDKKVVFSAKDQIGCKGDTIIEFVWQPAPPILIVEPNNFIGCAPGSVFFKNRSTPLDTTYNIRWDFGDSTYSNQISPSHIYQKPGTYSVRLDIVSPLGCKKNAYFSNWIKIRSTPKAEFDYSPKYITNLSPNITFMDKSTKASNWHWFFGKSGFSSQQNPTYQFKEDTGYQTIKLFVRNTEGCEDSSFQTIYITPEIRMFFPNAFSPNYDTVNDEFKGVGFTFGMTNFSLTVWNRWGETVFHTNEFTDSWNGLKNNVGEQVPDGVYMYEILYSTPTQAKVTKRDFITVYR